jgi:frataxin-like iron-binding protein CyaY
MSELSKELMIRSYNNISFHPERRGESDYLYYCNQLNEDLNLLGDKQGNYKAKFIQRLHLYYGRKSRTASSFICGPAKFPFGRNAKAIDSEMRAWEDFSRWRSRYLKLAFRVKTPSPEEEIDSALIDIDNLIKKQEQMKLVNKLIRKYKPKNALDICEEMQKELTEFFGKPVSEIPSYDSRYGLGYPTYRLTSISTKIRERKAKIEANKVRIERRDTFEKIEFLGGFIDIENDRVIIHHDEKPSKEIIEAIKSYGFRWSPKCSNWCRKHTGNAIYDAKLLLEKHLKGQVNV